MGVGMYVSFKKMDLGPGAGLRRGLTRAQADDMNEKQVDEESRLEALESSLRARKGAVKAPSSSSSDINGNAGASGSGQSNRKVPGTAEWKEGQLFPEGWEDMDPLQKVTELYLGKRGFLFWSTKLALGGVVFLVVAWIAFRFLGPALGLYQLVNDISTPSF